MRLLKLFILALCMFLFQNAHAAHQLYADRDGVNIPYGTKLNLTLSHDLKSSNVVEGDMFQAYLNQDLYVNYKLILPSKTIFRGRISNVQYSKRLSRAAILYLTLDHLVTKDGEQIPINSGLATHFDYKMKKDGGLTTGGNYFTAVKKDLKNAGAIVPRTIDWGATAGDNLFTGAKIVFVPVAALGGCIACVGSSVYNTVADLFRKGDEVIIKKGEEFDIILLSNLEIPTY